VAARLSGLGLSVVVLDRRDVATGSTSASTALLQYEIDVPLVELAERIGQAEAERAYRLSWNSIDGLEELVTDLSIECGFGRRTSLYLAHDQENARLLDAEATAREACGIGVRLLERTGLEEEFHVSAVAGLVSDQAATCDPYRLTHGLLQRCLRGGGHVFDRTRVTTIELGAGRVCLRTDRGWCVTADQAVIATGYEAQSMLPEKVVDLRSTYAVVSEPHGSTAPWDPSWIMWEARDPYLYLRVTDDGRLMAGGEDDDFRNPDLRDARVRRKGRRIREKVRALLPELEWEIEYAWAGTFGTTRDGLAYIGTRPDFPGCWFALGFGGNGITFSEIAANLLADLIIGRRCEDEPLFRFGR
jgi:glycine/D-amino acid oxidase-like deaminating enzyme